MSWCGRCFAGQPDSDFDSGDDGEYEYFVNSNYICKRKKQDVVADESTVQGKTKSSMSESGVSFSTSQSQSSSLRCRSMGKPSTSMTDDVSQTSSCETDQKSSVDATQLVGARIWQVGHATIKGPNPPYDPFHKPLQTLNGPSTSGSDRTTEIVFNQRSHPNSPKLALTPPLLKEGKPLGITKLPNPPSPANSKIRNSSKVKTRPGFIQRLFGRSGKSVFCRQSRGGSSAPSSFKESMEQPSPAITTNTLYWTVRVKMK